MYLCRYADRAKQIKNKAVVNENPMDKLIRYKDQVLGRVATIDQVLGRVATIDQVLVRVATIDQVLGRVAIKDQVLGRVAHQYGLAHCTLRQS